MKRSELKVEMLIEEKLKNLERKVDKLKLLNYNYSYIL